MNNVGIVYEILKNDVVVLTPEGEFITVKRMAQDVSLGMLIEFNNSNTASFRKRIFNYVSLASGIAALIVIAFIYFRSSYTGFLSDNSFCYIDVDINPSIGLVIDKKGNIVDTSRVNDDAMELMRQIKIEGQPALDTISLLIERCITNGYIKADDKNNVLISVSHKENSKKNEEDLIKDEKQMNEILSNIYNKIKDMSIGNSIIINPIIIKVPEEERTAAQEYDISMGRYHFYLEAKEKGLEIDIEKMKKIKISEMFDVLNDNVLKASSVKSTPVPNTSPYVNGGLKIQYYCLDKQLDTQGINYTFTIVNTGADTVNLKNVKVRYYFNEKEDKALRFSIYYFGEGSESDVNGKFYNITNSHNANKYLEITFSDGEISSGEIVHVRGIFYREDWSKFDQSDDYSFNAVDDTYVDWEKITIYVSDKLTWGIEP